MGAATLPAARALLIARCSREDVSAGAAGCKAEDPKGSNGRRALINEIEVLRALETVSAGASARATNPATLPLAQQVALMRSTDVLVGASGSALIGTFFLPPGAIVVELHSFQGTTRPDTTWHELGDALGVRHYVLHERHWPGRAFSKWGRREAMHVDTEELVQLVRHGLRRRACEAALEHQHHDDVVDEGRG